MQCMPVLMNATGTERNTASKQYSDTMRCTCTPCPALQPEPHAVLHAPTMQCTAGTAAHTAARLLRMPVYCPTNTQQPVHTLPAPVPLPKTAQQSSSNRCAAIKRRGQCCSAAQCATVHNHATQTMQSKVLVAGTGEQRVRRTLRWDQVSVAACLHMPSSSSSSSATMHPGSSSVPHSRRPPQAISVHIPTHTSMLLVLILFLF